MTSRVSLRMVQQQELYELFHDYWNVVPALNSYISVLQHSPKLDKVDKEAVHEVAKLSLLLEQDLESLRARMLSLVR